MDCHLGGTSVDTMMMLMMMVMVMVAMGLSICLPLSRESVRLSVCLSAWQCVYLNGYGKNMTKYSTKA